MPVTFRNNGGDANNTYKLDLGAVYVQDQIEITRYLQMIGGLRFDHFDLASTDRRTRRHQRRASTIWCRRASASC